MATEKFTLSESYLVSKIKQLIRESNVRRVRLIHGDKTILEILLSIGAQVAAITILAALGAFAALVT